MRKVLVVVERRADYSRYHPILSELKEDPFFELYLIVTGNCLLKRHGDFVNNIKEDGFTVNAEVEMFLEDAEDSGAEMVRAMSRVMMAFVDELEKEKPDLVLSGFDIGANMAITMAAAHMNIPVAHIQGGEVTGSIDESIRHAMSKFSHIHLPGTELSKQRLIQMGEKPESIYVVGCPSIDVLVGTPKLTQEELAQTFNLDFSKPVVLMIQHPVTTESDDSLSQIKNTVEAIKSFGDSVQTIVLLPNNDAGHAQIIKYLLESGLSCYAGLSTIEFVNLYRNVSVLVGNSSSGIHETATMKIPTVNIGTRQQGRERSANVLDVGYDQNEIKEAIRKALYDDEYKSMVEQVENIYGDGTSAKQIVSILKTVSLDNIVQKEFYDG